jgi:hypothetical protein
MLWFEVLRLPKGPLTSVWEVHLFMAVPMTLSAAVSDFGSRRYCRFGLKQFWWPQEPLIKVCVCRKKKPLVSLLIYLVANATLF